MVVKLDLFLSNRDYWADLLSVCSPKSQIWLPFFQEVKILHQICWHLWKRPPSFFLLFSYYSQLESQIVCQESPGSLALPKLRIHIIMSLELWARLALMLYVWQIRLDRITRPLSQNLGFGCLSLHQKHHFPAAVWVSICLKLGWIFCLLYGQKSTASVQRQPRKGPAKILKAENPKPKFKGRDLRITLLCCILLTHSLFHYLRMEW